MKNIIQVFPVFLILGIFILLPGARPWGGSFQPVEPYGYEPLPNIDGNAYKTVKPFGSYGYEPLPDIDGNAYKPVKPFGSYGYEPLPDIDGNAYKTVQIGEQIWMGENLRTSRYANGDPVLPAGRQIHPQQGVWAHYETESPEAQFYGKLYNWHAVNDPRGLCPDGWRVPAEEDWFELETYLGMPDQELEMLYSRGTEQNVGGKMKVPGFDHWNAPNSGATNQSGFNGLPGGGRPPEGDFHGYRGSYGFWWTATEYDHQRAWWRSLYYEFPGLYRLHYEKDFRFSVRCIRNRDE